MEWMGDFIKTYGLVGVLAVALLMGVLVLREMVKKKNGNGHEHVERKRIVGGGQQFGRRWDDNAADEDGSRITLKDIRTSIHAMTNDINKQLGAISIDLAQHRAETKTEVVGLHRRCDEVREDVADIHRRIDDVMAHRK